MYTTTLIDQVFKLEEMVFMSFMLLSTFSYEPEVFQSIILRNVKQKFVLIMPRKFQKFNSGLSAQLKDLFTDYCVDFEVILQIYKRRMKVCTRSVCQTFNERLS